MYPARELVDIRILINNLYFVFFCKLQQAFSANYVFFPKIWGWFMGALQIQISESEM